MTTVARAHPNIALVKYWGKADRTGNYPATPSLSITLDTLATETEVNDAKVDEFYLNGKLTKDSKVTECLQTLRSRFDIPALAISSTNNFPTAAGLASSASGFAALVTAVDAHCGLGLSRAVLSQEARAASGSAARSLFGGFVTLEGPDWSAAPLLDREEWELETVVAITETGTKTISSSQGMQRSAATSDYFSAWTRSTPEDFRVAVAAVEQRDFATLAAVAEQSCLKMHALMLSTRPALIYWNPATLACLQAVRNLQADGVAAFFTVDAGPQVKVVCLPEATSSVTASLESIPGVVRTITAGLGSGAGVISQ